MALKTKLISESSLAKRVASNEARRLQIIGTRGQTLGQQAAGGGGATNYTLSESRYKTYIGPADVFGLRLLYGNFHVGQGTGVFDGYNDITLRAALETTAVFPVCFSGSKSAVLAAGASHLLSDPLGIPLLASSTAWLRHAVQVASGQQWPRGALGATGGQITYESTATSTQIYGAAGALTQPSGGAQASYGFSPLAVLGIPKTPMPAVVILGDSISDGQGDSTGGDGRDNFGWIARGMHIPSSGVTVPYVRLTRNSDTPARNTDANAWQKRAVYQYATHGICALGINQLQPTGLTTQYNLLRANWVAMKMAGLKVYQTLISPSVDTTDTYITTANQTPRAGFEPGGIRDQLNAMILAAVGDGVLDGVIDPNPYWEDPANHGKWPINGSANYATTDGIHPTGTFHTAASKAARDWATTILAGYGIAA